MLRFFAFKTIESPVRLIQCFLSHQVMKPEANSKQSEDELDLFPDEIDTRKLANSPILQERSVLAKCEESLNDVGPYVRPTFNFASYIDRSYTLKQLVDLGVDLCDLERSEKITQYYLNLDYDTDVKPHVSFLENLGVPNEEIGTFINKNPLFFKETLDNLQVRINYLQSKQFTDEMILKVILKSPLWLSYSVKDIDNKLGRIQNEFMLSGDEVRALTTKYSKLIIYKWDGIREMAFSFRQEMGFSKAEVKHILMNVPSALIRCRRNVVRNFHIIHTEMGVPLEQIVRSPKFFSTKERRIRERYEFLKKVERLQFNPKLPNYISINDFCGVDDVKFATDMCKSTVQIYNTFLKTL